MTIKVSLVVAYDFTNRKGMEHGRYSCQHEGQWYIVEYGPKYSNTYRVTEFDDDGLKILLAKEQKE